MLAANAAARQQKLSVVVGLQRRHQRNYLEGVQKIRAGEIGDVTYIRTYFNVPAGGRSGLEKIAAGLLSGSDFCKGPVSGWIEIDGKRLAVGG